MRLCVCVCVDVCARVDVRVDVRVEVHAFECVRVDVCVPPFNSKLNDAQPLLKQNFFNAYGYKKIWALNALETTSTSVK